MEKVLVLLVMAAVASSQKPTYKTDKDWLKFKKDFHYSFSSLDEESDRYRIFRTNVDHINQVNRRSTAFKLGINRFTLFTNKEFKDVYLSSLVAVEPPKRRLRTDAPSVLRLGNPVNAGPVPNKFDWRTRNVVTPVKNQDLEKRWLPKIRPKKWRIKGCGACWAFSVTGAIESALAIAQQTGRPVSLSEQQILDCLPGTDGCSGGSLVRAFSYVEHSMKLKATSAGGIQTAQSYPYKAETGSRCKFNPKKVVAYMDDVSQVTPATEDELKTAVYRYGPVAVRVHATDDFNKYQKGVFFDAACGHSERETNHAMLVVGYGTEGGQDYWLVKNSWGAKWGEKGYIKMARNVNNMCGIATYAFFPTGVSPTPVKQNPALRVAGNQLDKRSPAGVSSSPCSSSAMVAINTSLLSLLFAAICSI